MIKTKRKKRAAENDTLRSKKYKTQKLNRRSYAAGSNINLLHDRLSLAKDGVRRYEGIKPRKSFAVTKLMPELMDRYIASVEVFSEEDIRIKWKKKVDTE